MAEASVKKKSGGAKTEDYEDEAFIQSLEPLSKKLQEQFPNGKWDSRAVSQFAAQAQQLTEDVLGIKSLPPRPFPKPPVRLFRDVKVEGSLHAILAKFHQAMTSRNLKRADFTNPYHRKQFQEILSQVVSELVKRDFLTYPKVFVSPECGEEVSDLSNKVVSLKGEVMTSKDSPGVTHIVKPFGPGGDPDDGIQYMRNLGNKGQKAKVHWWYYPDSYDEHVSLDDAPEVVEPDKQVQGPWIVYARWVKDSIKYNEWMNPIDYEVDDVPVKPLLQPNPTGASKQDVKTSIQTTVPGNLGPMAPPNSLLTIPMAAPTILNPKPAPINLPEVAPNEGKELQPGVIQQRLIQPDIRALNSGIGINIPPPNGDQTSGGTYIEGTVPYQLPAYAHWFREDGVHEREKIACPLFFSEAKEDCNEGAYLAIRKSIIEEYKRDVQKPVTLKSCQKLERTNMEAIVSVWRLLHEWGIINFQARWNSQFREENNRDNISEPDNWDTNLKTLDQYAREFDTARKIFRSTPFPDIHKAKEAVMGKVKTNEPSRKRKRASDIGQDQTASDELYREERIYCSAMPDVECTDLRYYCTKIPGFSLCPQAFANGLLPPGTTSSDFKRIDKRGETIEAQVWSDQETLLLLEGLEKFGDNWADVADHVGKSQVQCIARFLRIPIADEIADILEDSSGDKEQPRKEVPFSHHSNPIMAQVAFLVSILGPEIGSAFAQAALKLLLEDPENIGSDTANLREACSVGLDEAAVKARILAQKEEREARKLILEAVNTQVELTKLRLKDFGRLEKALAQDESSLKVQRDILAKERLAQEANIAKALSTVTAPQTFQPAKALESSMRPTQTNSAVKPEFAVNNDVIGGAPVVVFPTNQSTSVVPRTDSQTRTLHL